LDRQDLREKTEETDWQGRWVRWGYKDRRGFKEFTEVLACKAFKDLPVYKDRKDRQEYPESKVTF
jgi:hypothetical protein